MVVVEEKKPSHLITIPINDNREGQCTSKSNYTFPGAAWLSMLRFPFLVTDHNHNKSQAIFKIQSLQTLVLGIANHSFIVSFKYFMF